MPMPPRNHRAGYPKCEQAMKTKDLTKKQLEKLLGNIGDNNCQEGEC